MGAWSFIAPRFENVVGCKVSYINFSLGQNELFALEIIHAVF